MLTLVLQAAGNLIDLVTKYKFYTLVEKHESFVRFYILPNTFSMILDDSY